MVHELVYVSRSTDHRIAQTALNEMLAQAREKNERLGITGVLLYHEGEFVQLLEGETGNVRDLFYKSILRDQRHRRVFLCWEHHKQERSFSNWQMGFATKEDVLASATVSPQGFLEGGISQIDLSGPQSTGRQLLLSVYETMTA